MLCSSHIPSINITNNRLLIALLTTPSRARVQRSNFTSRCLCNPLHSLTVELSRQGKVLYTAERPGLCCAKPCLCCCACTDHCTDTMTLHEGHAVGNPGELSAPSPILMVRQEKVRLDRRSEAMIVYCYITAQYPTTFCSSLRSSPRYSPRS